ncbi:hypothetical protein GCM10010335_30920 [Streptomyces galbus]|nr:hypothetical protein GCM10010335_30920 [Streptomyces galbus]
MGRGDLSDEQWAVLEPMSPVAMGGRPAVSEYGPWQTVYGLFRRRQRDGTWPELLTRLQARADAAGLIMWEVNLDSTICRAHQHAAGTRRDGWAYKEPPDGIFVEPDDHGLRPVSRRFHHEDPPGLRTRPSAAVPAGRRRSAR